MTKIKLWCTACKGEVVYDKEKPSDDQAAHARLHIAPCPFLKSESKMSFVADHGFPVESEVLETSAVSA